MNKYAIIALIMIASLATACNKSNQYHEVNCEPVVVPTYGYGTSLTYNMKPTDSRKCLMTFHNTHEYPVNFRIEFPDTPPGIQLSTEEDNFSITATKNYMKYITLTTTNAATGFYEVPVAVYTDKGGKMGPSMLQITVSDINTMVGDTEPVVTYVTQ